MAVSLVLWGEEDELNLRLALEELDWLGGREGSPT